jgi:hypothetical protein
MRRNLDEMAKAPGFGVTIPAGVVETNPTECLGGPPRVLQGSQSELEAPLSAESSSPMPGEFRVPEYNPAQDSPVSEFAQLQQAPVKSRKRLIICAATCIVLFLIAVVILCVTWPKWRCTDQNRCAMETHGTCDIWSGKCICKPNYYGTGCGRHCDQRTCDPDGVGSGTCDQNGYCSCARGYSSSDSDGWVTSARNCDVSPCHGVDSYSMGPGRCRIIDRAPWYQWDCTSGVDCTGHSECYRPSGGHYVCRCQDEYVSSDGNGQNCANRFCIDGAESSYNGVYSATWHVCSGYPVFQNGNNYVLFFSQHARWSVGPSARATDCDNNVYLATSTQHMCGSPAGSGCGWQEWDGSNWNSGSVRVRAC